ncbi:MAG: iron-containing alcohol dehydrogenase [Eubacterium sp.]|nr:iron-containing alcohol dehydrogenase [Eubacterium sp.]
MLRYHTIQKTKVHTGRGSIRNLPALLDDAGFKNPFLVYDQGIAQTPIIPKIQMILDYAGFSYYWYDRITPDPTSDLVDHGAALFRARGCDCIIAIGGGSTLDASKGINVMCHNDGQILDYVGHEDRMQPARGLICIPTTAGTGSEISNWIVITDLDKGEKHPINVINSMCDYALLDPELTIGLPAQITAATGLDVFSHAFEAYTSTRANPVTDIICEKMMETVIKYLPRAVSDGTDIEARERMQISAAYGGWTLIDGVVHIGHCIGHEIGAVFHIPHGAAVSYAFPAMVKHIAGARLQKIRYTGQLLGVDFREDDSPETIAAKTAEAYIRFRDEIVRLNPISHYKPDLSRVNLDMARTICKDPLTALTPVPVTQEDLMYMLYLIFVG